MRQKFKGLCASRSGPGGVARVERWASGGGSVRKHRFTRATEETGGAEEQELAEARAEAPRKADAAARAWSDDFGR